METGISNTFQDISSETAKNLLESRARFTNY